MVYGYGEPEDEIEFAAAEVFFECNATDHDLGIQLS